MSLENKKNYYAIVPANVRYDNNLCANAKLLYGEITALCNERGYCWASNQYFADLYDVSKISISRWVSLLEKQGYIKVELVYKNDTKEVESRKIWIVDPFEIPNTRNNGNSNVIHDSIKNEEKYKNEIKEIIDYLNSSTNSNYRYNTESTNKLIRSKLNNGFTVQDIKSVIQTKSMEWMNTDFQKYLRPSTLFGNKFEQYLNQKNGFNPQNPGNQVCNQEPDYITDNFYMNEEGEIITF